MTRNLIANLDPVGRVWIEDANHGRFFPDGIRIGFPELMLKRDQRSTFTLAKKMAQAEKLYDLVQLMQAALIEDDPSRWPDLIDRAEKVVAAANEGREF